MGYRLLVVTGSNELLQALPGQLGADVEVKLVEMANDALWEVRSDPPHAIVADLDLPDMSGLDLAEILPNFDVVTRVLLVSPTPNPSAEQRAEELGVYRFLSGPATASLASIVYDAVRQASEAQQLAEEEPEPEPTPAPAARVEPPAPRPAPVIERIERTPPAPAGERTPPAVERIERTPPPSERPTPSERPAPAPEPARPQRRVVPNPDPPYQPPERPSTRRITPNRPAASPSAAPTPPPATSGGRLSDRARDARPAAAQRPAAPPPPEPVAPAPRQSSTMVVTAVNLSRIQSILSDLWQSLSAQCTLLTDRAGMVLAQHGETDGLPMMILLPLLSTSFSTAGEVARQLKEEDAMTLYMHDGARYNLYCFDIAQRFLLVVVFDKNIAATRIGSVWVEARSTIRKLKEALS